MRAKGKEQEDKALLYFSPRISACPLRNSALLPAGLSIRLDAIGENF
jgi:hypothetical protein